MHAKNLLLAAALALIVAPAWPARAQTPDAEKKGLFYKFSLAPKSAQANPRLDFTVVTDLTDEGRALRRATADNPAYYVLYSEGYQTRGDSQLDLKTLTDADFSKVLQRSLGEQGYHPAALPGHPPTLLVLYNWGSYALSTTEHVDWTFTGGSSSEVTAASIDPSGVSPTSGGSSVGSTSGGGYDPADPTSVPGQAPASMTAVKGMLDRAELIGGQRFVAQVKQMLRLEKDAEFSQMRDNTVNGSVVSSIPADMLLNPQNSFRAKSPRNDFIMEMAKDDLFYVVASAYDYQAFARQHKAVLLWRTHMAISAGGVTQAQTLPTLVMSASPYFGKDTEGPVVLNRQMTEKIEIGKPTVVGYDVMPPSGK